MPSTLLNTNEVAKEMEHTPLPQQAESTLGDTYQKKTPQIALHEI